MSVWALGKMANKIIVLKVSLGIVQIGDLRLLPRFILLKLLLIEVCRSESAESHVNLSFDILTVLL